MKRQDLIEKAKKHKVDIAIAVSVAVGASCVYALMKMDRPKGLNIFAVYPEEAVKRANELQQTASKNQVFVPNRDGTVGLIEFIDNV